MDGKTLEKRSEVISVIVPVYNTAQFLVRCVDSILAQTYENLEIILVDDGSKDESGKICDAYAERDSRIQVIHTENRGLSSARNTGVDAAAGDYIGFVDSDDYIKPEMFSVLLGLCKDNGTDISCCGRFEIYDDGINKVFGYETDKILTPKEFLSDILTFNFGDSSVWNKLLKRKLIENVRFPIGEANEDTIFMYHTVLNANAVSASSKCYYYYCHRKGSLTTFSEKDIVRIKQTYELMQFVAENCSDLYDAALCYQTRQFMFLYDNIRYIREMETKKTVRYYVKKMLFENRRTIVKNPFLNNKEKTMVILINLGLFYFARSIYGFLKIIRGER